MTALGVNVSTQDPTQDWTGLHSGHRLPPEIAEADAEAKRAWDFFTSHVDGWIQQKYAAVERGDWFAFDEAKNKIAYHEEQATLADMRAQMLRKQHNCNHVWDEGEDTCLKCGLDYFKK